MVVIGLALLADLRMVSLTMLDFSWWVFPLALLCATASFFIRFLRWHYYLHQIGVTKIRWPLSLRLFMAGFPLARDPGQRGRIDERGVAQPEDRYAGRTRHFSRGGRAHHGWYCHLVPVVGGGSAVSTVLAGFCGHPHPGFGAGGIAASPPGGIGSAFMGRKIPFHAGFCQWLARFYEGSYSLLRPGPLLAAVGLGLLAWGGMGMAFYMILFGLGFSPTPSLAAFAIFLVSLATMIGAATTLPGGLGAEEASLAGLLCLSVGASPAMAAAATLLFRLVTLWYSVGLGILVWTMSKDLLGLQVEHEIIVAG